MSQSFKQLKSKVALLDPNSVIIPKPTAQVVRRSFSSQQYRNMSTRRRPSYGDSAYYPAGWDRERLLTASMDDLNSLPPGEFNKIRQGMIQKMGSDGFERFVEELANRQEAALTARTQSELDTFATRKVPDFVRLVRSYYTDGLWGFVAIRSTAYEDDATWESFRQGFVERVDNAFGEGQLDNHGLQDVKDRFTLEWVEDPSLQDADVDTIARKYGSLQNSLPRGIRHPFCLNITRRSLESILGSSAKGRATVPFVRVVGAVSADEEYEEECKRFAEDEGHLYPLRFNVAVDSLLTEFFNATGDQSITADELGGHLKEDEVWTSPTTRQKCG